MPTFTETEQPIKLDELAEVERELNVSFPKEFVEHYLRYNGGSPDPYCFLTHDDQWLMIQEFLSIKYGSNTIEYTYRTLTSNDSPIPKNLIPFATDPGGNYFCILSKLNNAGNIYYYDGEHFDDLSRALKVISPSLDKFLSTLQVEPEDF